MDAMCTPTESQTELQMQLGAMQEQHELTPTGPGRDACGLEVRRLKAALRSLDRARWASTANDNA